MKRCPLCLQDVLTNQPFFHWLKQDALICGDCAAIFQRVDAVYDSDGLFVHVLYEYNDELENILFQYKEGQDIALRSIFLHNDLKYIQKRYKGWTLVLMPSSEEKTKERGFHALKEMLAELHLPKRSPLYKTENRKQSSLSFEQRQHIHEIIRLHSPDELAHKNILLVDDVCTTGATLQSAYALIQPYAKQCKALVLCANPLFLNNQPRIKQPTFFTRLIPEEPHFKMKKTLCYEKK